MSVSDWWTRWTRPEPRRVFVAAAGTGLTDDGIDEWLVGRGPDIVVVGRLLGLQGDSALARLCAAEAPQRFGYVGSPQPQ